MSAHERVTTFDLDGMLATVATVRGEMSAALITYADVLELAFLDALDPDTREASGAALLLAAALFDNIENSTGNPYPPGVIADLLALIGHKLVTDARLLDGRPAT